MKLEKRIAAFIRLGEFLIWFCEFENGNHNKYTSTTNKKYLQWRKFLEGEINKAEEHNKWFTRRNIIYCLINISILLEKNYLQKWINSYKLNITGENPMSIGVVMAGNIPLVGFFDFLCVLLSGNVFKAKLSSKDDKLFPAIIKILIDIESEFKNRILLISDFLTDFDAIIATGSNNTSRYFEYYFGKYPNILRKNRSSVAIITGKEDKEEIIALGDDILMYFGLGCRNVSKIFLPEDYSPHIILESIEKYHYISDHHKYANNYNYNKSVFLMNNIPFLDNGFLIMKEDAGLYSPVSVLFYEYYKNIKTVKEKISAQAEDIQCVISQKDVLEKTIPFGKSQIPGLYDYPDNIDTMKFLSSIY